MLFRFLEAKKELEELLQDEQIATAPVLILGNKIDKVGAVSEDQLRMVLGVGDMTTGKGIVKKEQILSGRPIELFMCSVLRRQGYGDAFTWLAQYLD